MSISKNDFYRYVNLGDYEEVIRKMIFGDSPGEQMDFPCMMFTYKNVKELPHQMISQPLRVRNNGTKYAFVAGGILYVYFISEHSPESEGTVPFIKEGAINENDEIRIIHMPPEHAKEIINTFMGGQKFFQ